MTPSTLPLEDLRPSRTNPRKSFDKEALAELTESVRKHGVLQPLLVRPRNGTHEIVAGERRYRAAKAAGVEAVPVVVREISDLEALELQVVENLQREDLHPLKEAGVPIRTGQDARPRTDPKREAHREQVETVMTRYQDDPAWWLDQAVHARHVGRGKPDRGESRSRYDEAIRELRRLGWEVRRVPAAVREREKARADYAAKKARSGRAESG